MTSVSAVAAAYDRHASIDELDRAIVTLAGRINAATYDLLVLIRRFDERLGWLAWGFESCADWLHY
ncbi:MAG TPA: HNH endonuclease, partial [Gammaproteobacteria bacterium]